MLEYFLIFIFGVFLGNFATTALYRLPRGVVLYGFNEKTTQPPFCSECKHPLKFYEYLPILSWANTRGSCNYCQMPITKSYFLLEIMGGVFAVMCALLYGEDIEYAILMFFFYNITILALFISYEHGTPLKEITISLLFVGILQRTLSDNSILPWSFILSLASIFLLYILKDNLHNVFRQKLVHIILPASVWLLFPGGVIFIIGIAAIFLAKKHVYERSLVWLLFLVMLQSLGLL